MTEAMPFLQKYDITFLRPLPIRRGLFCLPKARLMLFPLSRLRRQLSQRESQD